MHFEPMHCDGEEPTPVQHIVRGGLGADADRRREEYRKSKYLAMGHDVHTFKRHAYGGCMHDVFDL